jgi:Protein of unknown function (DUF2877)
VSTHLAAAAVPMHPMITGRRINGVVVGSFAQALIIATDDRGRPGIVSLLSGDATGVPNGVRLVDNPPWREHRPGEPVEVGLGLIRVGDLRVRVVRWWDCRVRPIRPGSTGVHDVGSAAELAARGVPEQAIRTLERALAADRAGDHSCGQGALEAAVDALVGLGSGLTPGGDDLLAGLLTALHACGRTDIARRVAVRALDQVTDRTTLLSADLLRLAARGFACLEALAVLKAIHSPEGARLDQAIHRLLSIGHSSGADLATGLAIGLRHDLSPQEVRIGPGQEFA